MARNPVQFQKGMSLAAFQAEYGGKESYEGGASGAALAAGFCLSEMPGPQAQLLRQAAALPVLGAPDANLAQSRHDLSQVQGSADDMVPRHLSSEEKKKR